MKVLSASQCLFFSTFETSTDLRATAAFWGTAVEIALPAVARAKSVRERPTGVREPWLS
jgi:hypothetical protein